MSANHSFFRPVSTTVPPPRWTYLFWGVAGAVLIAIHGALALLSVDFEAGRESLVAKPVLSFVGLELLACGVFLLAIGAVPSGPRGKSLYTWVIIVGIALRATMTVSTPILENDYLRYLWDGAVAANGWSPYRFSPEAVLQGINTVPDELLRLGDDGRGTLAGISYPHLRTIYPPVAQAAFAIAHFFKPWSLISLRLVLLLFDAATLLLLIATLRSLDRSPLWIVIYWWNPLIVKEFVNSAHLDVITLPLVVGAVMLTIRQRYVWAAGSLALATGAKLWPVVVLPVVLSPLLRRPVRLIVPLTMFVLIAGALSIPIYTAGLDTSSGFVAYAKTWEMNDALYMLFLWAVQFVLGMLQFDAGTAQVVTRVLVALILVALIGWVSRTGTADAEQLWERSLLIVSATFLLSPTQFPWYYTWVVPFLVIRPRASLLVLNALVFLYYLRFYFKALNNVDFFDYGIVWVEFLPVWCLLLWEWVRGEWSAEMR
jgi:alpha-1,6-mannosyltransferase